MKEKIKKFMAFIKKPFRKEDSRDFVYPIEIPLAGIRKDHIQIDHDAGYILIDAEQQILVEQADKYNPAKMYNSFGFSRTIFLPRGVEISFIDTKIEADRLSIGWPKQMLNQ